MGLRTIPIVVKLWHRGPRAAMNKTALCQSANHLPISSSPRRPGVLLRGELIIFDLIVLIVVNVAQRLQ